MNLWERFNNIVDIENLEKEKSNLKPIEAGTYTATLLSLEAGESKNGLPMLKAKFKLNTNQTLYYNQVLQNLNNEKITASNIAKAIVFLEGIFNKDIEPQPLGELAKLMEKAPIGETYNIVVSYGNNDVDKKFPIVQILRPTEF